MTRDDSTVGCQGWRGIYGLTGDGTFGGISPPVAPTGLVAVDTVQSSPEVACALSSGTVRCWGYNVDNQLGDGGPANQASFGPVAGMT